MSVVELRRNSSPHLSTLMDHEKPWRKSSHPPLNYLNSNNNNNNITTTNEVNRLSRREQNGQSNSQNKSLGFPSLEDLLSRGDDSLEQLITHILEKNRQHMKNECVAIFLYDRIKEVFECFFLERQLRRWRLQTSSEIMQQLKNPERKGRILNDKLPRCLHLHQEYQLYLTDFSLKMEHSHLLIENSGYCIGFVEHYSKFSQSRIRCETQPLCQSEKDKAETLARYSAITISQKLLSSLASDLKSCTLLMDDLREDDRQKPPPVTKLNPEASKKLYHSGIKDCLQWSPEFDNFTFSPRAIGQNVEYAQAAMSMFNDLGFTKMFCIRQDTLANFVLKVAGGYREVAYHNWSHAFAVTHFCWLALRTSAVRHNLDELERLSMLVACLCHDIDHRGTNNLFQANSHSQLAQLYSTEGSILERHHYATTLNILNDPACNILNGITGAQRKKVLNHVREVILATDLMVHMEKLPRIDKMIKHGYNALKDDHHYLFMCLLVTASDLSDQSKDFKNSKAIAENIYLEFFLQGDLERNLHIPLSEMTDRENAKVPKIQLEFMDTIAIPVFKLFSEIVPEGKSSYEAITFNRNCWKELFDILQSQAFPWSSGLSYLNDSTLEEMVIDKVQRQLEENGRYQVVERGNEGGDSQEDNNDSDR